VKLASVVVGVILPFAAVVTQAQKIEIAGTAAVAVSPDGEGVLICAEGATCILPGPTPSPTTALPIGAGFSWQASFAYRLTNFRAAALYAELPVSGSPTRSTGGIGGQFSSVFLTPSAQFKFLPDARISPFASMGAGVAHFSNTLGGSSGNTGAFQIGGGVDFRTPMRGLAIRTEVRDFITGRPAIGAFADFSSSHLQNIFAGGGFVLKF